MSTPSHHGVVPADTTEICWQMNLLRRGVGGTNHYVISVIRNACGELVLVGAWARAGR